MSPTQLTVLRRKVVEAVINQKQKQVVVARLFGISIRPVNKYACAYKEKGTASLTYKKRGFPKGYNTFMTKEMENLAKEVIETRRPEDMLINFRYYLTQIQLNKNKVKNYFRKNEVKYAEKK